MVKPHVRLLAIDAPRRIWSLAGKIADAWDRVKVIAAALGAAAAGLLFVWASLLRSFGAAGVIVLLFAGLFGSMSVALSVSLLKVRWAYARAQGINRGEPSSKEAAERAAALVIKGKELENRLSVAREKAQTALIPGTLDSLTLRLIEAWNTDVLSIARSCLSAEDICVVRTFPESHPQWAGGALRELIENNLQALRQIIVSSSASEKVRV